MNDLCFSKRSANIKMGVVLSRAKHPGYAVVLQYKYKSKNNPKSQCLANQFRVMSNLCSFPVCFRQFLILRFDFLFFGGGSGPADNLCPVDLHHADDIFPADGADVDLTSACDACTDVPAIIEQGILFFAVADLAEVHLLVGDLPVADAFAVALAVLVPADVLVAGLLLDKGALSVALVLKPVAIVDITGGILHATLAVAFSEHVVAGVGRGGVGDVCAFAVEVAVPEVAAVVLAGEGGVDCLGSCESLRGMVTSGGPKIANKLIGIGKEPGHVEFSTSKRLS